MIRVAVCGACGRMGRLVVRQVAFQKDMKLVAAIDSSGCQQEGQDAGEVAGVGKLAVKVQGANRLGEILSGSKPDVLVDFTIAEASVKNVRAAAQSGVSVVVGTTGFTPKQKKEIEKAVEVGKIGAVMTPNFAVGVNVFFKTVRDTAKLLDKGYEPEISEVHHIHKKDAPSGTALKAADIISRELGIAKEKIKIKSVREGEVVGEHTVIFSNPHERLEIVHRAKSREAFAAGAVRAARYVVEKGEPGVIEDMATVLGL